MLLPLLVLCARARDRAPLPSGLQLELTDSVLLPRAGAVVVVTGPKLEEPRTQVTDETGVARFTDLPPGHYSVTATLDGFAPASWPDVEVPNGYIRPVQGLLAPGAPVDRTGTAARPLVLRRLAWCVAGEPGAGQFVLADTRCGDLESIGCSSEVGSETWLLRDGDVVAVQSTGGLGPTAGWGDPTQFAAWARCIAASAPASPAP